MAKEKQLSKADLNDMVPKLDQFVSSLKPAQQAALARPFAAAADPKSQASIQVFLDAKVGNLNPHTRSIVAGVAAGVAGGVAAGVAGGGGKGITAGVAAGVAGGVAGGGTKGTAAGVAAGVAGGTTKKAAKGTAAGVAVGAGSGGGRGTAAGVAATQSKKTPPKKK